MRPFCAFFAFCIPSGLVLSVLYTADAFQVLRLIPSPTSSAIDDTCRSEIPRRYTGGQTGEPNTPCCSKVPREVSAAPSRASARAAHLARASDSTYVLARRALSGYDRRRDARDIFSAAGLAQCRSRPIAAGAAQKTRFPQRTVLPITIRRKIFVRAASRMIPAVQRPGLHPATSRGVHSVYGGGRIERIVRARTQRIQRRQRQEEANRQKWRSFQIVSRE